MRPIQIIRSRLGMSQLEMADALGVTQSNVSYYERGQTIPPAVATKLIDVARARGLSIGFDHVYSSETVLPQLGAAAR